MEPQEAATASALLPRPVHPTTFAASTAVRQAAVHHLEERRTNWAYSRPVVVLDIALNLAFAASAAAVLCATAHERPVTPVRLWISVYALQCLAHVGLVWQEYRRRRRSGGERGLEEGGSGGERVLEDSEYTDSEDEVARVGAADGHRYRESSEQVQGAIIHASIFKGCESINRMASFIWWVFGFCWAFSGSEALLHDAPTLYWLTVVFLIFDALFAVFCISFACIIGIALCCCLPCVMTILCSVIGQESATDADISMLSRYRYSEFHRDGQKLIKEGLMVPDLNHRGFTSDERVLPKEDAGCCICLTSYEDGNSLLSLPCNHHFHSSCIVKWLRINATCPLCKYHILNG
ncbi:E3 ubiquitin protein ligase RIE1-like isoform X1 [Zingiber officinale]|uniref:E3 ubiquitin protein ligase RIE1-like isoform X1 n=1 Tax=Zingiber officinale TaxID=94328 RepID=UPI001C4D9149|nr:E3 ubiquitin protein ligase RIE1-like isoform X1 [Zingiber officinale]